MSDPAPSSDAIPPLDLERADLREDPYPVYRWYREHCPVYRLESATSGSPDRYLLTRADDVATHLRSGSLGRTVHAEAPWNRPLVSVPSEARAFAAVTRKWPLFLDPPGHAGPRRAINRVLAADVLESMERMVREVAADLAAALPAHDPFDAMGEFAGLVPLEVNRRALGLRETSAADLRPHGLRIIRALGNRFDPEAMASASASVEHLLGVFDGAIGEQRAHPGGEAVMLQRLVGAAEAEGLVPEEDIAPLALLLLLTALDTTANLIGNGIVTFLRHPAELARFLEEDGPEADRRAATEVARFESPVQQVTRHALRPVEIRGTVVPERAGVSFLLGAANRDPERTADPDRFDVTRAPGATSAFGHGIHQCPGEALGLMEAAAAWRAFFARFTTPVLAREPLEWLPLVTFRGLKSLVVVSGDGCGKS